MRRHGSASRDCSRGHERDPGGPPYGFVAGADRGLRRGDRGGLRYGDPDRFPAPPTAPTSSIDGSRPSGCSSGELRCGIPARRQRRTKLPPDRARSRNQQEHRARHRETAQAGRITAHSRRARHQMCGQSPVNATWGEGNTLRVSFRPRESTPRVAREANGVSHPAPGNVSAGPDRGQVRKCWDWHFIWRTMCVFCLHPDKGGTAT